MTDRIPINPGETREFVPPVFEHLPEDERPTFILGAPDYRARIGMARFKKEHDRINAKILQAIGATPAQIIKEMEAAGEPTDDEEVVFEKLQERLREFNSQEAGELHDEFEPQYQEISLSVGFIEATLGKPGKPLLLTGWRNLAWGDGEEIVFNKRTYLEDLARWDMNIMIIVSREIIETAWISERAAKN